MWAGPLLCAGLVPSSEMIDQHQVRRPCFSLAPQNSSCVARHGEAMREDIPAGYLAQQAYFAGIEPEHPELVYTSALIPSHVEENYSLRRDTPIAHADCGQG